MRGPHAAKIVIHLPFFAMEIPPTRIRGLRWARCTIFTIVHKPISVVQTPEPLKNASLQCFLNVWRKANTKIAEIKLCKLADKSYCARA